MHVSFQSKPAEYLLRALFSIQFIFIKPSLSVVFHDIQTRSLPPQSVKIPSRMFHLLSLEIPLQNSARCGTPPQPPDVDFRVQLPLSATVGPAPIQLPISTLKCQTSTAPTQTCSFVLSLQANHATNLATNRIAGYLLSMPR